MIALRDSYAELEKSGEVYIYLYQDDEIKYIIDNEYMYGYYNDYYISQKDNMIYAIDILNEKIYSNEVDGIKDVMIVSEEKGTITFIDNDKEYKDFKEYKILLP